MNVKIVSHHYSKSINAGKTSRKVHRTAGNRAMRRLCRMMINNGQYDDLPTVISTGVPDAPKYTIAHN